MDSPGMSEHNETLACPYCDKGTAVEHVSYDNCFVEVKKPKR